jgi:acetylornithine aminotransferase
MHSSNLYYNAWTGELSKRLIETTLATGGMSSASRVFVCNSGSEANEAAIKFARKVGRTRDSSGAKHEVVSFKGSFHGRTMGALSATPNPKYQAPFSPMVPGFHYGTLNDATQLSSLITERTAGVLVEPIQGEGGVHEAEPAFLQALRDRCNAVGAVLIYDEIQCGLSRSGTFWAHAKLPKSAHPDILTTAKALGNGYPIGATIVSEEVATCIVTGDHGTTFGGNPLATRLAHHVIGRLAAPALLEGVNAKSALFRDAFETLRTKFPNNVGETRGQGLILGLQLLQDPAPVVTAARERGLLIITAGTNTLRLLPPLVITDAEISEGLGILEDAMTAVFHGSNVPSGTKRQQKMAP